MKKLLIIAALALCSTGAFADDNVTGPTGALAGSTAVAGQQQQQSTSSISGASASQGNSQNITFTSPPSTTVTSNGTLTQTVNGDTTARQVVSGGTDSTIHEEFGTQRIKNTPSVNASPLVSSNDTCMGSASASLNLPGVGLGFGKTYLDSNCVMLKNSREMWNMGMKAAALALMCTDSANRDALEITGFECPQTTRDKQKNASAK